TVLYGDTSLSAIMLRLVPWRVTSSLRKWRSGNDEGDDDAVLRPPPRVLHSDLFAGFSGQRGGLAVTVGQ
ncbi:MAG: hypothetical protein ACRDRU_18200, partial [Pseudonocardiaceae bacterium]